MKSSEARTPRRDSQVSTGHRIALLHRRDNGVELVGVGHEKLVDGIEPRFDIGPEVERDRLLAPELQRDGAAQVIFPAVRRYGDGKVQSPVEPVADQRQLVGRQVGSVEFLAAGAGKAGIAIEVGGVLVDHVRTGGQPVAIVFAPFAIGVMKGFGRCRSGQQQHGHKAHCFVHQSLSRLCPPAQTLVSAGAWAGNTAIRLA
jgi:hypothetical protein